HDGDIFILFCELDIDLLLARINRRETTAVVIECRPTLEVRIVYKSYQLIEDTVAIELSRTVQRQAACQQRSADIKVKCDRRLLDSNDTELTNIDIAIYRHTCAR